MFAWRPATTYTWLEHDYVIYLSECIGHLMLGYMEFYSGMYIIIIIKAAIF